jgi:thioester reductase-like protein
MCKLKLWTEEFESRIHIICGDLEAPQFGLNEEFNMLAQNVDIIIHCAGWVNFVYPYEALRNANVESVKEIIKLAITHKIKPINYVSSLTALPLTAKYDGEPYYEDENFEDFERLVNGYSQTKWAGEKILENAKNNNIPVNIYRPAFMIGHSKTGTANEKDLVWALIKGTIELGKYTDLGALQLVTVDYVSKFIVNAALNPHLYSQNYNLLSPEFTYFNNVFELMSNIGYRIEEDYPSDWVERIEFLANENALAPFLPLLTSISDSEKDYVFGFISYDDTNAKKAIYDTSIESPVIDDNILQQCVQYLTDIGYIQKI